MAGLRWTSGPGDVWCPTATLAAFGVTPTVNPWTREPETDRSMTTDEIAHHFTEGGWELQWLSSECNRYGGAPFGTVAAFAKAHPEGDWWICTRTHSMALRDGVLTDTAKRGFDRRHVTEAWRMTKKEQAA